MSISYYLLFFSLCLSLLHACNARPLGTIDDKKLEKKFHIPNTKNDKKGIDKIPVLPKTTNNKSNELEATRGVSNNRKTSFDDKAQKLKDTKTETITSGGADKTTESSLVSVSWRLPRNKRGEKHPGLNSDYSPPKTHPPSHN